MAIKNQDFGNFVGGFGEAFFKTLQSERERQDKLNQLNQEFSQRSREMNLLNAYRNKTFELQQQNQMMDKEKTEYDIRSDFQEIPMMPNAPLFPILQGGQTGGDMNKPFGGTLTPFEDNKFYAPKIGQNEQGGTKDARVGADGYVYRWDESKREYFNTGLKAPEKDIKNPTNPKDENPKEPKSPDLSNEIDDLEYWHREYVSKKDDVSLQNVKAKSESLMSKAGLTSEIDMVWNAYKDGRDYNGTIEAINNYRISTGKPELTDWQIDSIRRYYNARVPKAYTK